MSEEVIEQCEWMLEFDGKTVWNVIRGWLKKNGYRRYYNRIPQIIDRLGYIFMEGYTYAKYLDIIVRTERRSANDDCRMILKKCITNLTEK